MFLVTMQVFVKAIGLNEIGRRPTFDRSRKTRGFLQGNDSNYMQRSVMTSVTYTKRKTQVDTNTEATVGAVTSGNAILSGPLVKLSMLVTNHQ